MVDLKKLKDHILPYHHATESNPLLRNLMEETTYANYLEALKRYYGFYALFEKEIAVKSAYYLASQEFAYQPKLPLLEQDLSDLGINKNTIAVCASYPHPYSLGSLLGCIYVLEGSTMGRIMMWHNLSNQLSLQSDKGGRFFYGAGEKVKDKWNQFREFLEKQANKEQEQKECIQAAVDTFYSFNQWFDNWDKV